MSDGGRGRASLGAGVWKSSQKWGVQRSAVRSIAWLGLWKIALPLVRLCRLLYRRVAGDKKMPQIAGENQIVRDAAENAKRRLKIEDIAHDGDLTPLREEMIVVKATESAAYERIAEVSRRIEGRDAAGQTLPDAEMSGAPSDFLPERH